MHQFLQKHVLLQLTQYEIDNLTIPVTIQFSSFGQWCLTPCDPMASLSITNSRSLLKLVSIK